MGFEEAAEGFLGNARAVVAQAAGPRSLVAEARTAVEEALTRHGMFNAVHRDWHLKADFIVRKDEPYRRLEFERRRRITLGDRSYPVVAPEDLVLSKLCWRRESRSELQLKDIEQLLQSQPALDWPYLRQWAAELGVLADLEPLRD